MLTVLFWSKTCKTYIGLFISYTMPQSNWTVISSDIRVKWGCQITSEWSSMEIFFCFLVLKQFKSASAMPLSPCCPFVCGPQYCKNKLPQHCERQGFFPPIYFMLWKWLEVTEQCRNLKYWHYNLSNTACFPFPLLQFTHPWNTLSVASPKGL